jgi:hypothetical protein
MEISKDNEKENIFIINHKANCHLEISIAYKRLADSWNQLSKSMIISKEKSVVYKNNAKKCLRRAGIIINLDQYGACKSS